MGLEQKSQAVQGVSVPFVDLAPANTAVKDALIEDLARLVEDSAFIGGRYVEEFEKSFAASCMREECVGVSSGLDALRLALVALGAEPGDEVVVPAMTFIATFEAVIQAAAVPVVVDVLEEDCGLDVGVVDAACGPRTRFVMPVHLYGQMMDVSALQVVAAKRDLMVVEDACQAHGAERDGMRAGAVGVAAAFSFYPSKNLGAMGDAGALVTDDPDLASRVRALRQHGETSRYRSEYPGYTARLDAIQALVLSHKLPLLDAWNSARASAAGYYLDGLAGVGDLRLPVVVAGVAHVWHLFTVRTADPSKLAEFMCGRGVGTGRHYPEPPHLSAAFRGLGLREGAFPVAEAIARETLSLPLFPGITELQLESVVNGVRAYFAGG